MALNWYFGAQGRRACRRASFLRVFRPKSCARLQASRGCTKSSTTASEVLARKDGNRIRLDSCVNDVLRGNRAIYKARLGLLD